IDYFIEKGFKIYIPDVVGIGELNGGALKGDAYISNVPYSVWYTAMLIGRSIVGIQAADINKLAKYIQSSRNIDELYGVAKGAMTPTLLHCGAFDTLFSGMLLIGPYASYSAFVENQYYDARFVYGL